MILKILKRRINTETKEESTEEIFIDGFDYINVDHINYQEEKSGYSCPVTNYMSSVNAVYAIKIMLVNNDNTLRRVLYIDSDYSCYLMSNGGKTIERIN